MRLAQLPPLSELLHLEGATRTALERVPLQARPRELRQITRPLPAAWAVLPVVRELQRSAAETERSAEAPAAANAHAEERLEPNVPELTPTVPAAEAALEQPGREEATVAKSEEIEKAATPMNPSSTTQAGTVVESPSVAPLRELFGKVFSAPPTPVGLQVVRLVARSAPVRAADSIYSSYKRRRLASRARRLVRAVPTGRVLLPTLASAPLVRPRTQLARRPEPLTPRVRPSGGGGGGRVRVRAGASRDVGAPRGASRRFRMPNPFSLLRSRLPGTRVPAFPVLLLVVLLVSVPGASYAYNRAQGEAFITSTKRFVPDINSALHDGYDAAQNLDRAATSIVAGKGRESLIAYSTAAGNLAGRATEGKKRLADMQLNLNGFDQLPLLPNPRAQEIAGTLRSESWYTQADSLFGGWARNGKGAQEFVDTVQQFIANEPDRETNTDPISFRQETLLRLDALAQELGRESGQLNSQALTAGAESSAARFGPKIIALAEPLAVVRQAVVDKNLPAFKKAAAVYVAASSALQDEILKELHRLALQGNDPAAIKRVLDAAQAAAVEVSR